MSTSVPVFEARAISKSFGPVQALSNVTVTLHRGEIHSVIGENGAGKSTLMNIICGRLSPTEGQLFVDGAPVQFHSPKDAQRHGIAIAPQEISLVPDLTVDENILLGAQRNRAVGIDWRQPRCGDLGRYSGAEGRVHCFRPFRHVGVNGGHTVCKPDGRGSTVGR